MKKNLIMCLLQILFYSGAINCSQPPARIYSDKEVMQERALLLEQLESEDPRLKAVNDQRRNDEARMLKMQEEVALKIAAWRADNNPDKDSITNILTSYEMTFFPVKRVDILQEQYYQEILRLQKKAAAQGASSSTTSTSCPKR